MNLSILRSPSAGSSPVNTATPLPNNTRQVVHFELEAPTAWRVSVIGSFNGWLPGKTPLRSIGRGKWAADVELPAGRHEYRFLVDGEIQGDPLAKTFIENPFGGMNAVVTVCGSTPADPISLRAFCP